MERFTSHLRTLDAAWIVVIASLAIGANLGGAGRLSYHEAIVAQGVREMIARGQFLVPTLGGLPWLEKPPLLHLLVVVSDQLVPLVGPEGAARLPSAVAATLLALGVGAFAAHRFGRRIGRIAGALQATTFWTIIHGRLAESDILLAALVVATFLAFDRLRDSGPNFGRWRWAFFALLGATSLAKGIGFGAVLILATLAAFIVWERRWDLARRLVFPPGILFATVIALAWPVAVWVRHPQAIEVWTMHIADRLGSRSHHFAGEKGWEYALSFLWQTLPWTPLSLLGAWHICRHQSGLSGTRALLLAWGVIPAALVSLASTKNAHYLIYAFPPWSVWGALGLARLLDRARLRGVDDRQIRRRELALFATVATSIGLGIGLLGPRFDRRGVEWGFYAQAGRAADGKAPLILVYDDWDRLPYPTPFGPVPHDLAVRLFYLDRPASWTDRVPTNASSPISVIARSRDLPALRRLGSVSLILPGPSSRWDRTFGLYRITPQISRQTVLADHSDRPDRPMLDSFREETKGR
jgi:4-amino-4-deoxy-L-arabinose transferase-like glycosyltransferase